jgi:hypothetical protein
MYRAIGYLVCLGCENNENDAYGMQGNEALGNWIRKVHCAVPYGSKNSDFQEKAAYSLLKNIHISLCFAFLSLDYGRGVLLKQKNGRLETSPKSFFLSHQALSLSTRTAEG